MRIANTETPTFAGSAGRGKAPGYAEKLTVFDRDGNSLGFIQKDVAGSLTVSLGALEVAVDSVPELPAEADVGDVIAALISLGLVTQAAE